MIISPIATGNGAYILHKSLEKNLSNYEVASFNPYETLFPPSLIRVGRSKRANIIHTTPDYGLFHYRRNVPLVTTFHGYMLDDYVQKYSSVLQNIHRRTDLYWFTRAAIALSARITAVSRFTAELVRQDLNVKKDIRVIYNGIDESLFTPSEKKQRHRFDTINVLFSGNLKSRKGAQWLLPILEKLDHRIIIQYTSGLMEHHKLPAHPRLECVGSVPYHDMPALYRQADMLLFPTVREGFGLAAAEAMACGLPVIATDCSSLPELIDHGKGGYLCPLGDVQAFADSINRLAENPHLRQEMGEYNRSKIEKFFTLQRMAMEYQRLFEEILDTPLQSI